MNWYAGLLVVLGAADALALGLLWERWGWQPMSWVSLAGIAFITAMAVVWA